jgi:ATP-dependent protease HslVU (ClpYQ) peptidase subunit
MTSIAVVKKDGYVAIAADTLTKWGYAKESAEYVANHEKIFKLGGSYVGMSGSVGSGVALKIVLRRMGNKAKLNNVEDIFMTWNEIHRTLKDEFFLNPHESDERSFETSRMTVLIANPYGIFGIGEYRSVQEFTKFHAYGSGNEYAQGAMYAAYDEAGKSAEEIARLGVEAAVEFDEDTGLPIMSYALKLRKS